MTTRLVKPDGGSTTRTLNSLLALLLGSSDALAPNANAAARVWSGAVTATGFSVCYDVTVPGATAGLVVSANPDLSSPVATATPTTPAVTPGIREDYYPVRFDVAGLTANTTYYYAPVVAGVVQNNVTRTVKTFPAANTAAAFRFVFGSCSVDPSLQPLASGFQYRAVPPDRVYSAIAAENPLFFMHIGDIDYSDIEHDDLRIHRTRNSRMFRNNPDVEKMCRTVPIVYMWDDHDAGANDCELGQTYKSRATFEKIAQNGRQVIRETTPIYPTVQDGLGGFPITQNILSQVFDVGKCRFIMPDLRSQRRTSAGTMLGRALGNGDYWDQRSWLLSTLAAVPADRLAFLVSSSTWTGGTFSAWTDAFPAERQVVTDGLLNIGAPVVLLDGDAHESAFDDGTNSASSSAGGLAKFPQVMSSPLSNPGTTTGAGPFIWNGVIKRLQNTSQCFAVVDVAADGSWSATLKGAPFDDVTGVATTYFTASSTDAAVSVGFSTANSFLSPAGSPLNLPLKKSWFGPANGCSVSYSSSDGDTGTASFAPNNSSSQVPLPAKANGQSVTVTLGSPVRCVVGSPSSLTINFLSGQAETFDIINRMTVQPNGTRITAIDTYVAALKTAGVWTLLDRLYVMAAHDKQAAGLNWKKPDTGVLIEAGGPTWTTDRGYQGDGVGAYLNPSYVLTGTETYNYAMNSGHIGGWSLTDNVDAAPFGGSGNANVGARANASNNVQGKINGAGAITGTVASSIGHFVASRTSSANFSIYSAGAAVVTNNPSDTTGVVLTTDPFYILRRVTNFSTRRLGVMHWGGGMTSAQVTAFYNATLAYMQAVGAA